ncbi:uncharacterized protein LOC135503007 [Lineus longissimus]|uniref:uncharacterized protein LOC135503007 n=1 Tax=Lineus longissimus TaxID=88925 RepID=UPI00315C4BE6
MTNDHSMTVDVIGKERCYKTQELYTLKYADVVNLIKENGSLVLREKADMDKSAAQAEGPKLTPRVVRTGSEPSLLPPLNRTRIMKDTTWIRYAQNTTPQNRNTTTRSSDMSKVKDGEKKKVRALSPINSNPRGSKDYVSSPGPVLLNHSPYKLEDAHPRERARIDFQDVLLTTKKKRKNEVQNKENRPSNRPNRDKFVDYLNQKRELTKQIHLKSNHVDFHERPGQTQKNRMSYPMVRPRYREEVSIRNKLEEFKRWHEQEYRLRYTKNKMIIDEGPKLQRPSSAGRQRKLPETAPVLIKKIQVPEVVPVEKVPVVTESSSSELVGSKRLKLKNDAEVDAVRSKDTSGQNTESKASKCVEKRVETKARRTRSTKISVPPNQNAASNTANTSAAQAPASAKTWRTWRAPDTSCAYQDVKQYIEDNELMPESKEKMIRDWVQDVDRYMNDIQEENEETEIGESYPEPIPISSPTESLSDSSETA